MNVGIIGGADGPTEIFLAGAFPWGWLAVIAAILIVAGVAFFAIHNHK